MMESAPDVEVPEKEKRRRFTAEYKQRIIRAAGRYSWATMLDEGKHLCSWRKMYRLLAAEHEVRERRDRRRHPENKRPEWLRRPISCGRGI